MLLKNDYRPFKRYKKDVYLTSTLFLAFVFVLGLVAVVTPVYAYVTEDIAVWHFDDASGSIAVDSTINNNNLSQTDQQISWTINGKYNGGWILGGGMGFDLTGIDYLGNYDPNGISGNNFTMGFWVKVPSYPGNWFSFVDYNNNNGRIQVIADFFQVHFNGIDYQSTPAVFQYDNNWHFIVSVINDNNFKLYYDNVVVMDIIHTAPLPITINTILFGHASCCPGNWFNGYIDDAFFTKRSLTADEIFYIYTSQDAYTGEFVEPEQFLEPAPTITTPTELQQIDGTTVNVTGECWFPGIDIIDQDTQVVYENNCHYDLDAYNYSYAFIEKIEFLYDSGTGRPGGYVEFIIPPGYFAGIIRQDGKDVKIVPYNNDIGGGMFNEFELDYWFGTVGQDTVFKFYADDEPPGNIYPNRDYYLTYSFQFEDQAPTIIQSEPTTDYTATLGNTFLIKGDYDFSFNLTVGDHTITARSMSEFPQEYFSAETDPVNFTLLGSTPPGAYTWTQPTLWYNDITDYQQPSAFLSVIFETADGVLAPLMARINDFNTFFDTDSATADGTLLADGLKTVISYTKLFDNFFGSLPISWALLLLMIVYVAKFVIIYTAKAIQTFKPL